MNTTLITSQNWKETKKNQKEIKEKEKRKGKKRAIDTW